MAVAAVVPKWGKEVKKKLIDRDLTVAQLATELGCSRIYLSNVIHGHQYSSDTVTKVSELLGVPEMGMMDVLR